MARTITSRLLKQMTREAEEGTREQRVAIIDTLARGIVGLIAMDMQELKGEIRPETLIASCSNLIAQTAKDFNDQFGDKQTSNLTNQFKENK